MSQGLDANNDTTNKIKQLQAKGIKWVGRYINPGKAEALTLAEARALADAIPRIYKVSLWEEGFPDHVDYFHTQRGLLNGRMAHDCSQALGQPSSAPDYFTVDYDTPKEDLDRIIDYFTAIRQKIGGYLVGVYGNGYICRELYVRGLVHFTWLAGSTSWSGYEMWKPHAQIVQSKEVMLAGLDVDLDTSSGAAGGW